MLDPDGYQLYFESHESPEKRSDSDAGCGARARKGENLGDLGQDRKKSVKQWVLGRVTLGGAQGPLPPSIDASHVGHEGRANHETVHPEEPAHGKLLTEGPFERIHGRFDGRAGIAPRRFSRAVPYHSAHPSSGPEGTRTPDLVYAIHAL